MKKSQRGFTIIELIVVIAIIAVLATIVTINIARYINKAKESRANTEVENIEKSLSLFYAKYGNYPYNYGSAPNVQIKPGSGDPYLVVSGENKYLSEFYKFDWNSTSNANYFVSGASYTIILEDRNGDSIFDCGYIYLSTISKTYGVKSIICGSNCDYCTDSGYNLPFQTTPY